MAYSRWLIAYGSDQRGSTMAFRFEGLEIFHIAVDFSVRVHGLVKKFSPEERFDLTLQAKRAVNSIALNIAEGSGRGTKKDFAHFLDMAMGSTFETVACFFIARKQSYLSQHELEAMKRDG